MTKNLSHPIRRGTILFTAFVVILTQILWSWVFLRFVHAEAQSRPLMPQYYDVQVVSADEYGRLADRSVPTVTLADGTTYEKAPAWYEVVLPAYKATPDHKTYVLVTTYGTGHVLSYVEPTLFAMGLLACLGLGLSLWNLRFLKRESTQNGDGTGP